MYMMAGEEQFWLEQFSIKQSAWFWDLEARPGEEWILKEQGAEDSRGEFQAGPTKAGKIGFYGTHGGCAKVSGGRLGVRRATDQGSARVSYPTQPGVAK